MSKRKGKKPVSKITLQVINNAIKRRKMEGVTAEKIQYWHINVYGPKSMVAYFTTTNNALASGSKAKMPVTSVDQLLDLLSQPNPKGVVAPVRKPVKKQWAEETRPVFGAYRCPECRGVVTVQNGGFSGGRMIHDSCLAKAQADVGQSA
jgi:hypothetical protein